MSGILRRLKRSRTAGAGEVPPPDHDSVPAGAPTPPTDSEAGSTTLAPAPAPSLFSDPDAPLPLPPQRPSSDAPDEPRQTTDPPTGSHTLGTPTGTPPDLSRDPAVPAGLDPAEAAARPPTGRRGRLRRRLRYLRRARELMLRDLGGLVYEIHRTGGGDIPAHGALLAAKVQRMMRLDAEAHALEAALSAPREHVMLFEPGVGGTCDVCGELYPSDARFCAHCGSPTGGEPVPERAPEPTAEPTPASERAPTLADPVPEPVVPVPEPPPEPAAPGAEAPTSELGAGRGGAATAAIPVADADRAGDAPGSERDEQGERAARQVRMHAQDAPSPTGDQERETPRTQDDATPSPNHGRGPTDEAPLQNSGSAGDDSGSREAGATNGPRLDRNGERPSTPGDPDTAEAERASGGDDRPADDDRQRTLTRGNPLTSRKRS